MIDLFGLTFGRPEPLWLLWLMPFWALWARRVRRRRDQAWTLLAQRGRAPGSRSLSMMAGVICLILAMAQPRFGRIEGRRSAPGKDVVLAIDVSRSMAVEDAVPDRMAAAVESAESLVRALATETGSRAAVIAFAGRGVLRCPLTENLGAVIDALHRLRPGVVRPGGTNLGAGLDAAIEAFGIEPKAEGRTLVVFSDGEDHEQGWRSRIERLIRAGVMVHTVALGDPEQGHPVPSGTTGEPLQFRGEVVLSRRRDQALEAIADQTDGAALKLGLAATDLGRLYRDRIAQVARHRRDATRMPERAERFPLFLAASLGLVLAASWPPGRLGPLRWLWSRAFGLIALTTASMTSLGAAQQPQDTSTATSPTAQASAADAVSRGRKAYAERRFAAALDAFKTAMELSPDRPVPLYDAAATAYQLDRPEEARRLYLLAREHADASLRTKIDYALGNTALILGDVTEAISHYDACLASAASGGSLEAVRRDATLNRRFAIEKARKAPQPEQEESGKKPLPQPRQRAGAGKGQDEGRPEEAPQAGENDTNGPEGAGGGTAGSQSSRRRGGGAGGASTNPKRPPAGSPEARLESAIDQIRDAKERRLPEEEPPRKADDTTKDW